LIRIPEVTVASQSDESEAPAPADEQSSAGLSGTALWEEARIEPVEIALPGGVGLTLRAFRMASELTPTELEEEEEDPFDARKRPSAEDDEEEVIVDEEYQALLAEGEDDPDAEKAEEPDPADFEDEKEEEDQAADEEVPMFLSHKGRLLAFKTPESLVSFI